MMSPFKMRIKIDRWLLDHFASCIFFALRAFVVRSLNNHGSWHDSKVAENRNIYNQHSKLRVITGGKYVVDFVNTRSMWYQETKIRQSIEWGMWTVQRSFPGLKDRFMFSSDMKDRRNFFTSDLDVTQRIQVLLKYANWNPLLSCL